MNDELISWIKKKPRVILKLMMVMVWLRANLNAARITDAIMGRIQLFHYRWQSSSSTTELTTLHFHRLSAATFANCSSEKKNVIKKR